MRVISNDVNFPFMKFRFFFAIVSICLLAFSIFSWNKAGLAKYSVDFLGGTELILNFEKGVDSGQIRKALNDGGITGAIVQSFNSESNDFTIRLKGEDTDKAAKKVTQALEKISKVQVLKQDFVGPTIGKKIREDAFTCIGLSLLIIGIYITYRFEWRFAIGALVATIHDIIITAGTFIFFGGEVGSAFLAGMLTVVGYSLNDTIIVFDRARENILGSTSKKSKVYSNGKKLHQMSFKEIFNLSINQTLSRTILTSGTTLFVTFALLKFGGGALYDLSLALLIGVVFGTYSSIFVASPSVLLLAKEGTKK